MPHIVPFIVESTKLLQQQRKHERVKCPTRGLRLQRKWKVFKCNQRTGLVCKCPVRSTFLFSPYLSLCPMNKLSLLDSNELANAAHRRETHNHTYQPGHSSITSPSSYLPKALCQLRNPLMPFFKHTHTQPFPPYKCRGWPGYFNNKKWQWPSTDNSHHVFFTSSPAARFR
jgi:hypothetical protein